MKLLNIILHLNHCWIKKGKIFAKFTLMLENDYFLTLRQFFFYSLKLDLILFHIDITIKYQTNYKTFKISNLLTLTKMITKLKLMILTKKKMVNIFL